MPIVDKGTHICESCRKAFEWKYFEMVRSKLSSSNILSEEIPDGECLVYSCEKYDGDIIYRVNCPHCDFENVVKRHS